MVPKSSCTSFYEHIKLDHISYEDSMVISKDEIADAFDNLPFNKAPGLDGISSEHFKYAGSYLAHLFSSLMTSLLMRGFIPSALLKSIIVHVLKDKNKKLCDKNNCRPICLSNTFTKVIEFVLFTRMDHFLSSTDNQFGFKPHHSTELCVFVRKEIIRYYIQHGSTMFVAFLDASKAFDRVNHMKLLSKLTLIGVLKYILMFLSYWYSHQSLCVRWRTVYSDLISVTNGVRQGGSRSPLLFNIIY